MMNINLGNMLMRGSGSYVRIEIEDEKKEEHGRIQ